MVYQFSFTKKETSENHVMYVTVTKGRLVHIILLFIQTRKSHCLGSWVSSSAFADQDTRNKFYDVCCDATWRQGNETSSWMLQEQLRFTKFSCLQNVKMSIFYKLFSYKISWFIVQCFGQPSQKVAKGDL